MSFDEAKFLDRSKTRGYTVIERTSSVLLIRIGGNQNYRCAISPRTDCFLQFKTV